MMEFRPIDEADDSPPADPQPTTQGRPVLPRLWIPSSLNAKKIPMPNQLPPIVRRTRVRPNLSVVVPPNPESALSVAIRGEEHSSSAELQPPDDLEQTSPVSEEEELTEAFGKAFADHMRKRDNMHADNSAASSAASSEVRSCDTCPRAAHPEPDYEFSPPPSPLKPWSRKLETQANGDPDKLRYLLRERWIRALQCSGDDGDWDYLHLYGDHHPDSPIDWQRGRCSCRNSYNPLYGCSRRLRLGLLFADANDLSSVSLPDTEPWPKTPVNNEAVPGSGEFLTVGVGSARIVDDTGSPEYRSDEFWSPGSADNQALPGEATVAQGSPVATEPRGVLQEQAFAMITPVVHPHVSDSPARVAELTLTSPVIHPLSHGGLRASPASTNLDITYHPARTVTTVHRGTSPWLPQDRVNAESARSPPQATSQPQDQGGEHAQHDTTSDPSPNQRGGTGPPSYNTYESDDDLPFTLAELRGPNAPDLESDDVSSDSEIGFASSDLESGSPGLFGSNWSGVHNPFVPRYYAFGLPRRFLDLFHGEQGTAILVLTIIVMDLLLMAILFTLLTHTGLLAR